MCNCFKKSNSKTPEVIGDFTSNKSVGRITKVLTQLKIDKRQIKNSILNKHLKKDMSQRKDKIY